MITLLQPKPGGWLLMTGPPSKNSTVISTIVHLTQKGPLRVLDCADYFPDLFTAQGRARRGKGSEQRVTIARATTCLQVLEALRDMRPTSTEFVVLDMLRPFFQMQAEGENRTKILKACIRQLDRLAKKASGIVTVTPPVIPNSYASDLLGLLDASADRSLLTDPTSNGYTRPGSAGPDFSSWSLPIF